MTADEKVADLERRLSEAEAEIERQRALKEAHRSRAIRAESCIQSVFMLKYMLSPDNRGFVWVDELFEVINLRKPQ